MTEEPQLDFLPELWPFDGNWSRYSFLVDQIYERFFADFVQGTVVFKEKPIVIRPQPREDDKEVIFWHIATRVDKHVADRVPDMYRLIRVHWIRHIVENYTHPAVVYFVYQEGSGRWRHYFWLRDIDNYLVILEESPARMFLVSAYLVDKVYMLRDLERKLEWYLRGGKDIYNG